MEHERMPPVLETPRPVVEAVSTLRYAIVRHIPRDVLKGKFAPDTVTLSDAPKGTGKGKVVPVLIPWWDHIARINSPSGLKYARSVHMMWININYTERETPKAERITCGGNFVSILEERGKFYRIDSFSNEQSTAGLDPARDNWFERPELFFKAIAVNAKGDLINVAKDLDVYFPLLNRKGDGLWVLKDKVELFASLPVEVTVTADSVDLFDIPGGAGLRTGSLAQGMTATVLEYRLQGASVWGRTREGWIPLLITRKGSPRQFSTTWTLNTMGVIPPPD